MDRKKSALMILSVLCVGVGFMLGKIGGLLESTGTSAPSANIGSALIVSQLASCGRTRPFVFFERTALTCTK
jgi:hypothetical protein